jgi:hypothetical protein
VDSALRARVQYFCSFYWSKIETVNVLRLKQRATRAVVFIITLRICVIPLAIDDADPDRRGVGLPREDYRSIEGQH